MKSDKKIGLIGYSNLNDHPYAWPALFNGFSAEKLAQSRYPQNLEVFKDRSFPDDGINKAEITHIWTQDKLVSQEIAAIAFIPNIVDNKEDLIGEVDAVLMARGDVDYAMCRSFIEAGLPIFIDKPFALSKKEALRILNSQLYENQVVTGSATRFMQELHVSKLDKKALGKIKFVEGTMVRSWEFYGIHLLESSIYQLQERGKLTEVNTAQKDGINVVYVQWENLTGLYKTLGDLPASPAMELRFYGTRGCVTKSISAYQGYFEGYKGLLENFLNIAFHNQENLSKIELLEIVEILEKGIVNVKS